MEQEAKKIVSEFGRLADIEMSGVRPLDWKNFSELVLGNVAGFQMLYKGVDRYKEENHQLQKELANIVNRVTDYYNLPRTQQEVQIQ